MWSIMINDGINVVPMKAEIIQVEMHLTGGVRTLITIPNCIMFVSVNAAVVEAQSCICYLRFLSHIEVLLIHICHTLLAERVALIEHVYQLRVAAIEVKEV